MINNFVSILAICILLLVVCVVSISISVIVGDTDPKGRKDE